jgi:hypothetical protein
MMGNSRLSKVYALLYIRGAQAHVFADGTATVLLKGLQNPAPCGIGNCVQYAIQIPF